MEEVVERSAEGNAVVVIDHPSIVKSSASPRYDTVLHANTLRRQLLDKLAKLTKAGTCQLGFSQKANLLDVGIEPIECMENLAHDINAEGWI
jgi:hypothetical protein